MNELKKQLKAQNELFVQAGTESQLAMIYKRQYDILIALERLKLTAAPPAYRLAPLRSHRGEPIPRLRADKAR